ncbi:LADA_0D11892g1_1 [Lachancea dasiensis]|uniref:LADA_0D11892g1_1 n=1 Tax=Lachancea dasiensis TaxID=1072105 RepID=A0A1G4J873_9SACH|nr:LADA_0D11892g1_1 [Lachancea dasiensis]
MRGRSGYRNNREGNGSADGNSSGLSTMLNGGSHHKAKRASLQRTSSLKLPDKQLYTVSENSHEESAIPKVSGHNHALKLMANHHRSSAAMALYNNLKNKRNSSNISLKDVRKSSNGNNSCNSASSSIKSQRLPVNLYFHETKYDNEPSQDLGNNPIHHYQFGRNMGIKPKSSSTTLLPTMANLRRTESNHPGSSINLKVRNSKSDISGADTTLVADRPSGGVDFNQNGRFLDPHVDSIATTEALSNREDNEIKILESQIETAINDEVFSSDYAFDNKFDDVIHISKGKDNENAPSITSSNQSPLTKVPGRKLSKTESNFLENFQNDISSRSSAGSQAASHTSRLQMKLDIMKSRFDSFTADQDLSSGSDNCLSVLKGEKGSHGSEQSLPLIASNFRKSLEPELDVHPDSVAGDGKAPVSKFWLRYDLKTKLLTEKLNNQLKMIERFPSSNVVGEKIMISRIKHFAGEKDIIKNFEHILQQRTDKRPVIEKPVVVMRNDQKDQEFEQLFESTKNYVPRSTPTVNDAELEQLRDKMGIGKTIFEDLWRDSEHYELLSLTNVGPGLPQLPMDDQLSVPKRNTISDHGSSDGAAFAVSPEDYR